MYGKGSLPELFCLFVSFCLLFNFFFFYCLFSGPCMSSVQCERAYVSVFACVCHSSDCIDGENAAFLTLLPLTKALVL